MNHYPTYTKDAVMDMAQSQISTLIEMIGYIKNPEGLNKYKKLSFSSEFEFEQYILRKFHLS